MAGELSTYHSIQTERSPPHFMKFRQIFQTYTRGSISSSVFNLLTTSVGAGTLSLPYAFAQGGLVFSSIVFLLILLISIFVGLMLYSSKRYCEELYPGMDVGGYEDIAVAAFGTIGRIIILLTLVVLLLLSLVAYMIYTRDQLDSIVQFIVVKTGNIPDCSVFANCAVLVALAFIPLFPVTLLRDLTPLQFTSALSILGVSFTAVAMIIRAVTLRGSPSFKLEPVQLYPTSVIGAVTCVSYSSLCFLCHFNILPLQKELYHPTKGRVNAVVVVSLVTAYVLYNAVIFSGYFTFYSVVNEDILTNYDFDDLLITAARTAIFFTLLFCYPVLLHPTRSSLNRLIMTIKDIIDAPRSAEESPLLPGMPGVQSAPLIGLSSARQRPSVLVWVCETWIIFGSTFLAASYIPNVSYVWNFVGSIGGTIVLYIFPSAAFLRLRYKRHMLKRTSDKYKHSGRCKELVAIAILISGLCLLVVENYSSIYEIISGAHDPTSLCSQMVCVKNPSVFSKNSSIFSSI